MCKMEKLGRIIQPSPFILTTVYKENNDYRGQKKTRDEEKAMKLT